LKFKICQGKKLSWRRRLKMLRDICRGMMCIQRMNIVHRDLKSANCLVDKHWTVKFCDFGLSQLMTELPIKDSTAAGTPEWMAPELLRNEQFTDKCDVFSLGVIIWELCTFCGVFRRQALDRGAAMVRADKIETGHNADDIAETVLLNILRGDMARLSRCTLITTGEDRSIPRCKAF